MDDTASDLHLDEDNPWPGLAAYDETARRFFHGREADSAELLRLIKLSPFVALYGKSGLGKSSVLQAGLFPQLRAERFLPVYLRLDYTASQPVLQQAALRLREEIKAAGADAPPPDAGEGLWAYLQRRDWPIWTADNFPLTPVLVFDQFEEVFSRGASAEHMNAVLETMADLAGDRLPAPMAQNREAVRRLNLQSQQYRLVLSFRSDFLADVEAWEKQANLPRRESLHLTALSRERAVDAIEQAGAKVLEPGVAQGIVDFLLTREGNSEGRPSSGRNNEVEPVLMSLCCTQLNSRRKRPAKIDAALLNTVGEGILKGFYEEALAGMRPEVSVFIEENLIQGERFRNSYARDAAVSKENLTEDELNLLTKRRLLRVDPQGGEPRVELIHDRLVGVVREARDARRALERQQQEREQAEQQASALREQAERDAKAKYDRQRLEQAEDERKRVARSRNVLAVAAVLLVVAVGWAVYFARAETRAAQAAKAAFADANARADEAAKARADAVANNQRALDELDKVNLALTELQQKTADKGGSAAGDSTVRTAATEQAYAATREVLNTVAAATQKIQEYKTQAAQVAQEEPQKPVPVQASPPPAPPPPPPPKNPAAATGVLVPAAANVPTWKVSDWRLSSGGCRGGDVTAVGEAVFSIQAYGDNVIVRERFAGQGNGFDVQVKEIEKQVPRSQSGYYDVETSGEWAGPNGRKFRTRGVDRVFVKDGTTPIRANVLKVRTECAG